MSCIDDMVRDCLEDGAYMNEVNRFKDVYETRAFGPLCTNDQAFQGTHLSLSIYQVVP